MRSLCVQQMTMRGEIHEQGPSILQIQTNLFHKLRIIYFFLNRLNSRIIFKLHSSLFGLSVSAQFMCSADDHERRNS